MPREDENVRSEASPHPDGVRESIINDSTGVQMGIRSDVNSERNPLNTTKTKDDKLKKLEEMTRGNPVD